MPQSFDIKLNTTSLGLGLTCRESAAGAILMHFMLHSVPKLYEVGTASYTLLIKSRMDADYIPVLTSHIAEVLHDSVLMRIDANNEWGSRGIGVSLTGPLYELYYTMWWVVLFMRLLNHESPEKTGKLQIDRSDEDEDYCWSISEDKYEALEAFERIHKVDRMGLFISGHGPATENEMLESESYKKLQEIRKQHT